MSALRPRPINEARRFDPHELFFSLTDPRGKIRFGNQVFTRVSGYSEEELLGRPHNVIRHPDMPRCVFQLLWDYLESGRTIAAYVKNLAADGRYYWVLAVATPCDGGYLSVRLCPTTPLLQATSDLYAEVLAYEKRIEEDQGKKAAIEASTTMLLRRLEQLGFPCYDDFMRAAVQAEVATRAPSHPVELDGRSFELRELHDSLQTLNDHLAEVFSALDLFEGLSERLLAQQPLLGELGPSLSFMALNTEICSARLGDSGKVLAVISKTLGDRSREADCLINTLLTKLVPVCDTAREVAFDIAVAQLESDVCRAFVAELGDGDDTLTSGVGESLEILSAELVGRGGRLMATLESLSQDLLLMRGAASDLLRGIDQMRAVQINGKIEVAVLDHVDSFLRVFDDIAAVIDEAKAGADEVEEVLQGTSERLTELLMLERTFSVSLGVLGEAVEQTLVSTGARAVG